MEVDVRHSGFRVDMNQRNEEINGGDVWGNKSLNTRGLYNTHTPILYWI